MTLRTYKRRNRGERTSGSLISGDVNDEFGFMGWRGPLSSQEEDGASTSSSSFRSASQQELSSFPSSQGSDNGFPTVPSLSIYPQYPTDPAPSQGKSEQTFVAGQKLCSAGTLLKQNATKNSVSYSRRRDPSILSETVRTSVGESSAGSASQFARIWGPCAPPTSTLMEAQESGEMMEHVDEANFALDGLRPGQPLRIRQASLVSLLSICSTTQRRRLLRTHGMVKPVLDAVLTLPLDDASTALAAAALLYVIAYDGQDEDFLGSSDCIRFLMKLLGPTYPPLHDERTSCLGSRLLTTKLHRTDTSFSVHDQGTACVADKVKLLLSSMKSWEDGLMSLDDQSLHLPSDKLSSTWVALLTLEKACFSNVILEDSGGSIRRIGGHFKERLRDLGGLDALCALAADCFLNLREISHSNSKIKNGAQSQCCTKGARGVGMLLRCLKVMENVTFLSENNQKHLLDIVVLKDHMELPHTFVGVIISAINLISDIIISLKYDHEQLDGVSLSRGRSKLKHFDFDEADCRLENDNINHNALKKQTRQKAMEQRNSISKSCDLELERTQRCSLVDASTKARLDGDPQLLEECLLSAVKVLMNLTNDNDLGCCQVAAGPGLGTMASLILKHYPSFQASECERSIKKHDTSNQEKASKQPEPDLDLLVVVLGVLVNLVEKDVQNRGRLAALNIGGIAHGMIRLLCSIFISKEGAGHSVEETEGKFEIDDETSFREGQQEAEDMIIEAYSALLLAFLAKEGLHIQSKIGEYLPNGNLSVLVPVLERFLAFHLSLNMLSDETHATVRDVIEACKRTSTE